jgi:hypothetical protein
MPRSLSIAIIAGLCFTLPARADDKPSPAVKRILDKTVAEVKKNRQEFDKANAKPLGDARVELQDLSTKLIKDGKTVDATAVLKQIENLEADVMRMAKAPAPIQSNRGVVDDRQAVVRQALCASNWMHNKTWLYSFTPDGRYALQGTPRNGTYAVSEDGRYVVLLWNNEDRVEVITVGATPESWKFRDGSQILPQR